MMRGRPGRRLARVAVGSAVFAGTAGAVQHHQQKRWARKEQEANQGPAMEQQLAEQQGQIEQLQQQQQYAPPPPQYTPPAAPAEQATPSYVEEIQRLATLRDQGFITTEDFEAKKKQLLGI
jgi:hypothetical protein